MCFGVEIGYGHYDTKITEIIKEKKGLETRDLIITTNYIEKINLKIK